MEQHPIACHGWPTFRSPDEVMVMPSRQRGNLLVADGAQPVLLLPEVEQVAPPAQVPLHFHIETMFKVGLPCRVEGVGFCFDLLVPDNGHRGGLEQVDFSSADFPEEHPILPLDRLEVFPPNPLVGFAWVSAFDPSLERSIDCIVDRTERFRAHHMPVILRPSSDDPIEEENQVSGGQRLVRVQDASDRLEQFVDFLWRWFDQQFPALATTVFAQMLAQEIKPGLDMGDDGLLWREFQL
jgi:hypothetical protein